MNKCLGCGSLLQSNNIDEIGYTKNINNNLCERCFRIRNYNDYKLVSKSNEEFVNILKNIGTAKNLVVLVIDIFNIPKNIEIINKYLNNDILLVLTKRDILPLSVYDIKLIDYFKRYNLNIKDTIIISSVKNYNFDLLIENIRKYQNGKDVYVVGFTNAGKSTMINKILYNYTSFDTVITTSMLPSTTIDSIQIDIDDTLKLIDTPGLLDNDNIINYINFDTMKKVVPKKEIKPKTYQIKSKQTIFIEDLVRLDLYNNNSLTFYISNNLNIDRKFNDSDLLKNLCKHEITVSENNDIVIDGLGFIKFVHKDTVILYTLEGVDVYTRDSLI